jgi:hypothetical protein
MRKPQWTKDDSHDLVKMTAAFVPFGALCGFLSGEGILWGAAGGASLVAIITIGAILRLAYDWLQYWRQS